MPSQVLAKGQAATRFNFFRQRSSGSRVFLQTSLAVCVGIIFAVIALSFLWWVID